MRGTRGTALLLFLGALPAGTVLAGTVLAGTAPASTDGVSPGPTERWLLSVGAADAGRATSVVEVLADARGVRAFRTGGRAEGSAGQVSWDLPDRDAVALDGSWWALARPVQPVTPRGPEPGLLEPLDVDVVDATVGDPDGDGADEVVVVFRRPFRATVVSGLLPDVVDLDLEGRSLHLGIYGADLEQEWVAGTVFRPVSAVAACDGALALAFASSVDTTDRVAAGASLWGGFGFISLPGLPDLPGVGEPACADVDGDGRTEPVVINRTPDERTTP